jgi:hypothetical protein
MLDEMLDEMLDDMLDEMLDEMVGVTLIARWLAVVARSACQLLRSSPAASSKRLQPTHRRSAAPSVRGGHPRAATCSGECREALCATRGGSTIRAARSCPIPI